MPPHPLTNFEIQKYCQIEPKFDGVYSRNNLPKTKDGAYVINLDESKSIGIHCIALYVNVTSIIYFDNFRVDHIPKGNKHIITNIYRRRAYDLILCWYFHIEFIDFMLKGKSLLDYTNLFSLNDYEKNDKIILKYFQQLKRRKNYIALFVVNI